MKKFQLILFLSFNTIVSCLKFENNGYRDLVVSISPDLAEDQDIIDKIKVKASPNSNNCTIEGSENNNQYNSSWQIWVSEGSIELFRATHKKAFIESVIILVPESWKSVEEVDPTTGYTFQVT